MPSVFASRTGLNRAADYNPPRSDSRDRDVGVERVSTCPERLAGHYMDAQAPAHGDVEVPRQRGPPSMGLDLDVVARQGDAVEPQAADARDDRGPSPVLEHEAQSVLLRSQADQVGESLSQVAWQFGTRARRRQR